MSMHLVGPYLTTTRYNSKKKKLNTRQQKAQSEHEKWLKKMGIKGTNASKTEKIDINNIPDYKDNRTGIKLSNKIAGAGAAKERQQYTGTYIIGIATTHKSNLMPVTSKKQAIEASTMRRN